MNSNEAPPDMGQSAELSEQTSAQPNLPPVDDPSRPKGFVLLIPGVYMRRLVSKDQSRYCEIRFEDLALLLSLKAMMSVLQEENVLEPTVLPVAIKVLEQVDDPKRRKDEKGHHLLLELEESIMFFDLLAELDNLDQAIAEKVEKQEQALLQQSPME